MEVSDYRNDVILAEACRQDVDKFCKDTRPGARGRCACACGWVFMRRGVARRGCVSAACS
jgi:hypothetical protein